MGHNEQPKLEVQGGDRTWTILLNVFDVVSPGSPKIEVITIGSMEE